MSRPIAGFEYIAPVSPEVSGSNAPANLSRRTLSERPQPRRRGRKRTLLPVILRASMRLFARNGFEQPTLDEVAKAAGVRKATLYSYFDSKSALIDAAVDQWLRELPTFCPTDGALPLRQQLISIGLQLQKLAAHPVTVSLTERLAEKRLSPGQMAAWRSRYDGFEDSLAGLLERHCNCERPRQVAHLFLLLAVGDLRPESAALHAVEPLSMESVVELILRAYPPFR